MTQAPNPTQPGPLIGDPDSAYLRSLALAPLAVSGAPPVFAANGKELEAALNDGNVYSGIFINPKLAVPSGIPLLQMARTLKPSTPIFYIQDAGEAELPDSELRNLTIIRIFRKPLTYPQILQAIASAQLTFDPMEALAQAGRNQDPLGVETAANETDFVPILAPHFLAGSMSYFDIYVRLFAQRYVKVLKAGDGFSPQRLNSYLSKGVTHFYLRRESQVQYLQYCDRITTALVKQKNLPQDLRVSQVLNHGQETASLLRTAGLSEDMINYAVRYAENVMSLIRTLNLEHHEAIRDYMKDLAQVEHGVATTMIASLLAIPLNFEAEKTVSLIGLASFFHDIGLQKMDPKFTTDETEGLSPAELETYRTHPAAGAQILSQISSINPTVIQAVLQHHERRDRGGFPNRLGSGGINRIAEMIAISEEFVHLLHKKATGQISNPLHAMELHVFNGFSAPVIAAFKTAFPRAKT